MAINRDELRDAINAAARALEAYWDAELAIEALVDTEIDNVREWIQPWAVSGGEIDDESLDAFVEHVQELRAAEGGDV